MLVTQGGASLALGYSLSPLQGCGVARLAKIIVPHSQGFPQPIFPGSVGRWSLGAELILAMLLRKAMVTWSPSKRQVTVS